jgi:hypothetical protein
MLATARGGHDAPQAGVICFLVVVIIRHSHNPLSAPLTPLHVALGALLASRMAVSDGVMLLLPRVASLLLGTGRSSVASLSVSYRVAMLCSS